MQTLTRGQGMQRINRDLTAFHEGILDADDADPSHPASAGEASWDLTISAQRFTHWLAFGNTLYELISTIDDRWRQQVFRGEAAYQAEENELVQTLYRRWLEPHDRVRERLEFFERHHVLIDGGQRFRLFVKDAQEKLSEWVPPVLSRAKALRTVTIPQEEAARLGFLKKE